MKASKRAAYKTYTPEEETTIGRKPMPHISCGDIVEVDGEAGIYETEIYLGTDIGITKFNYEVFSSPNRFQIIYDGEIVADSKYVGNISTYRSELMDVDNQLLPIYGYNGFEFVDTETTESITIESGDIANGSIEEPTSGKGVLRFNKNKVNVKSVRLRVTGALEDNLWNISSTCPELEGFEFAGSDGNSYNVKLYGNVYNMSCYELYDGQSTRVYTDSPLDVGSKVYLDSQKTQPITSPYIYSGYTVYVAAHGEIYDKYPCSKVIAQ